MPAFNAACTYIAEIAYEQQLASKFKLQRLLYYEVRQRFGLSAQLAIRAIAKVVEAYKRDKSQRIAFRLDGAVVYDERILSFQGLDAVSLTTLHGREVVPMQMGDYQRVQLHRAKGQADLIVIDGVFYLLVTIDSPAEPPIVPECFLGVDLGIVNLATDSDGHTYTGADVEIVRQRCLTHRKTYQATGTKAAKRRLKKLASKESRFRRLVHHTISKRLVAHAKDTKAALSLEDLTGILDRTTVRKGQRNKHYSWRAMAQGVVHQVAQMLAPGCVPLFLTDGFKEYQTALLTHFGHWVDPGHWQTKPRWMPCTPAMAAGLTDRVWALREVLLYRVPPWPQPQAL